MKELIDLINAHPTAVGVVGTIVLSAAVRAMPEPQSNGGMFYRWLYTFSHLVLSNYDKIRK
jgi:hypothetical protein